MLPFANRFEVSSSTLHRLTGKHVPPKVAVSKKAVYRARRRFTLTKINAYADRGTPLTPQHVSELASPLSDRPLGRNWTTTFLRRHADRVCSRYYRVQEVSRPRAEHTIKRAGLTILLYINLQPV